MSLLPQQILPEDTPLGVMRPDGKVIIDHNWWLFLYNIFLNVLGAGSAGGLPADALQDIASADADAIDSDSVSLRQPIANALVQTMQPSDVVVSSDDLPDIPRALLLAQDGILPEPAVAMLPEDFLLQDAPAAAQPVSSITVGASPFTYTAPFAGSVAITGGTVTAIALIRQGVTVATGLTAGIVQTSRGDEVKVTYSSLPTMTFIPWSPA